MRKVVSLISVFLICVSLCACGKSNENVDNGYGADTTGVLTKSEAESKATSYLYDYLKIIYNSSDYDISQTRYSVASVNGSSHCYEVNGTYSLYDKYGNFMKRDNFSISVYDTRRITVDEI